MDERWHWGGPQPAFETRAGRSCLAFADGFQVAQLDGAEVGDGWVEVDLSVEPVRAFHGVFWRRAGETAYESFFVRPHQVGNPDAIQYTPVWNGMSAWQLYHGEGFWNDISFPLGEWFTIRVVFTGDAADIYVADLARPALEVRPLLGPPDLGQLGVLVGGPGLRVAELRYGCEAAALEGRSPASRPGCIERWDVSDPFSEQEIPERLDTKGLQFTSIEAEQSGLVNLSRLHPVDGDRNTVYARAVVSSAKAHRVPLAVGFSDRVVLFLNGERLYRGADTYRSRDYRFLGSVGFYDTVYLPLEPGENELVAAVSEDFGGWGIMARWE